MQPIFPRQFCFLLILLCGMLYTAAGTFQQPGEGWRAGIAKEDITPIEPMFLAGYASRTHEAEGVLHKIWAKAVLLEDSKANRVVMITTDLLGMPRQLTAGIKTILQAKYGFTPAQVLINSSHTHTGPVLKDALFDIYELDAAQLKKIDNYTTALEKKILNIVDKAVHNLRPVKLFAQNGAVRFQVNRRNNAEANLVMQSELKGPNDYAVPVIKVEGNKGELLAVLFGYACHPTVLDLYKWSGDYAGFAQAEFEKNHPGTMALFFQGAGADQNPLPRRTVALAEQYGKELTAAVERVLKDPMQPLTARLQFAYYEVNLPFDAFPSETELEKMINEAPSYQKRWAKRMLAAMRANTALPREYPFPVQVWRLGEQPLFALGGELVIQYAINIKKRYGRQVFVAGYSNDVMSYIPSELILKEGGYEGALAHYVYGLPAKWAPGVEEKILKAVDETAQSIGLMPE